MNNKRTITIELSGGPQPHLMLHAGEVCDDQAINKLANILKVELGKRILQILAPCTEGVGFGKTLEEAMTDATASVAANQAGKVPSC
jgi:hypothetical protein